MGSQAKTITVNAMIAKKNLGGRTPVPAGRIVSGGVSASRDTSIIGDTPILKDQGNRGCAKVTASIAAPEDTTILRCVSLTRHVSSQNSLVVPGDVLTPDVRSPAPMEIDMKGERPLPIRIGGKKIRRDEDPAKGATYAMLDDTMSSISVHSSASNVGMRRKRATAEDDFSVVIGRRPTGRNPVNPHGRKGGDEDEGDGTG